MRKLQNKQINVTLAFKCNIIYQYTVQEQQAVKPRSVPSLLTNKVRHTYIHAVFVIKNVSQSLPDNVI